ncbi:hypothetical protein E2C01_102314 [Portunus trituberculatus]|uniref:Uncharacterized protein n=1 Tax=Portunus trituberculatus TaxID=210409 RepID=A0A5B7KH00_PORTR|nr:hypothetical protein [Portunus trituberculatus]
MGGGLCGGDGLVYRVVTLMSGGRCGVAWWCSVAVDSEPLQGHVVHDQSDGHGLRTLQQAVY